MEILKKNEDGLERSYLIALSRAEIEKEELAELQKIRAKVRMDGFRPGKVPLEMVKKMYGASAEYEAKQKAVEKATKSVLGGETNLSFGSNSKIVKDDENGIEFELNFEKVPTFELKDFSEIKLEKMVAKITDEDVEKELLTVCERAKKWVKDESGAPIKKGQKIKADVSSSNKNLKDDIKGFEVEIDDEDIMDEFREPFIGAKCGDTVKFVVHYPKNHRQKKLAGKNVDYTAVVTEVFNPDKYAIDEDFATAMGFKSLEEAREKVRENLTRRYGDLSNSVLKRDLLEQMSEMYDFDVPSNMLKIELNEVTQQIGEEASKLGKEMTDEVKAECEKIAKSRIRLGFVVAEIAKKNKIAATQNELRSALTYLVLSNPDRRQELIEAYKRPGALQTLAGSVVENKTAEFILKGIEPTERKVTIAELIAKDEEKLDCFKEEDEKKADAERKRSRKAANTKAEAKSEPVKSSDESSDGGEKLGEKSAKPSNGKRKTTKEEGSEAEKTAEKKAKKTTAKKV